MQKINNGITVALTALAALMWVVSARFFWWGVFPGTAMVSMATTLSFAACVGWVLVTVGSFRRDEYTRCRKCEHILRGLTEPRCPECGEPI